MKSETSKLYLSHIVSQALSITHLTPQLDSVDIQTPDPAFGDYSINAALVAAKKLKMNPVELAEKLVEELKKLDIKQQFQEIYQKGGFINFRLAPSALLNNVNQILDQGELYGCNLSGEGKKVVFEYSSPNTNKPLHIGHVRNDVYGQSCIRLLKSQGYQVVACEIINDRGIHIMKSVLMYQKYGNGATPESKAMKPDHFVGEYYRMFAEKAAESPEVETALMAEAQDLLKKWEDGDTEVREVWKKMNDWWYAGVQQTYEKEGTKFDEVDHESEIYDKGRDLVLQGVEKGVFAKEEDGSVSVDLTADKLDKKYLLRKDGTTIYITQDLYLWHLRNERHHPYMAMVTTAAEQAYHFQVLSKLFKLLDFPWAQSFKHLPYEHVYLGKSKMSSRSGNTVSADELLESVKEKVRGIMKASERIKASVDDNQLVENIAFGAIKYGYLKYEPNTRIYFDLDSTISMEGNTGPYIQYAHARISSILKNAGTFGKATEVSGEQSLELDVMRKLLHFPEIMELATQEYKPNLLCSYLYELAQVFNAFYATNPVLQEPDEQLKLLRLNIIMATAQVIKNGLYLLGIEAPEEM